MQSNDCDGMMAQPEWSANRAARLAGAGGPLAQWSDGGALCWINDGNYWYCLIVLWRMKTADRAGSILAQGRKRQLEGLLQHCLARKQRN